MAKNKKTKRRIKTTPTPVVMHHLPPARHKQVASAIETANSLISQGKHADALDLCQQLTEIEPRNAEVILTIATAHEQAGNIALSGQAYQDAAKLAPNFIPAMVNHALMLYRAGFLESALSRFNAVLALAPDFLPALDGTSRVLFDLRRYQQVVPVFEKLVRLRGTSVDLMELARVQELAGSVKSALGTCQHALSSSHDKASVEILAGMFNLSNGNKPEATSHFDKALAENPDAGFAHFHLAKSEQNPDRLPDIEAAILRNADKSVANIQAPLQFAKGYLLEKTGNYRQAFQAFNRGNELVASIKPDDNQLRSQLSQENQKTYTQDFIAELHSGKTDQSKRPVFVTGLPRSGTTLVEQIIAGHSDATGLGEVEIIPLLSPVLADDQPTSFTSAAKTYRKLYPTDCDGQQRIVDKSISSVLHLGAIIAMFPNATIICCQRNPMDVAWSAFKQYFNDGALAYTYSFDRIALHQNIYAQAANHWHALFPQQILKVNYEDLVTEPESNAKALISHINLPWQQSCMDFHKSKTPVRTASYDQVRQPIFTSSVGGWKPYEPWLGDLKKLLDSQIEKYKSLHGQDQ